MMKVKTKQRFKHTKGVNVERFTDEELFKEVIKRVIAIDNRVCYFIDKNGRDGAWNIHSADCKPLIQAKLN